MRTYKNPPLPRRHKPPIGLTPRWVIDEQRFVDILNAIVRYAADNRPIPDEWVEELAEINQRKTDRAMKDEAKR